MNLGSSSQSDPKEEFEQQENYLINQQPMPSYTNWQGSYTNMGSTGSDVSIFQQTMEVQISRFEARIEQKIEEKFQNLSKDLDQKFAKLIESTERNYQKFAEDSSRKQKEVTDDCRGTLRKSREIIHSFETSQKADAKIEQLLKGQEEIAMKMTQQQAPPIFKPTEASPVFFRAPAPVNTSQVGQQNWQHEPVVPFMMNSPQSATNSYQAASYKKKPMSHKLKQVVATGGNAEVGPTRNKHCILCMSTFHSTRRCPDYYLNHTSATRTFKLRQENRCVHCLGSNSHESCPSAGRNCKRCFKLYKDPAKSRHHPILCEGKDLEKATGGMKTPRGGRSVRGGRSAPYQQRPADEAEEPTISDENN